MSFGMQEGQWLIARCASAFKGAPFRPLSCVLECHGLLTKRYCIVLSDFILFLGEDKRNLNLSCLLHFRLMESGCKMSLNLEKSIGRWKESFVMH